MADDSSVLAATVIKNIDRKEDLTDPNIVKAVIDHQGNALYFSRAAIPFGRDPKDATQIKYYKHLGIYAYQKKFLFTFKDLPKSDLEKAEKLEQLRIHEAGYKIKTVLTDKTNMGVDTSEDLKRVVDFLKNNKGA